MRFAVLALGIVLWTAGCSREKTPYTAVDETNNPPRITPALTSQPVIVSPAPQAATNQSPNR
jgi:hypothetical protein